MTTETIIWRNAATDPPNDDTTVLVSIAGGSEPVWLGYLDDGEWRQVDSASIDGQVVSWADVPEGFFPTDSAGVAPRGRRGRKTAGAVE